MVIESTQVIPSNVAQHLLVLNDQHCTLQRVGSDRSLFIGFGRVAMSTNGIPHGICELGTYRGTWRLIQDGKVLLGREDPVDSARELNERLCAIKLGQFKSLRHLSNFDLRITFSSGLHLDILCAFSDCDEIMHVFLCDNLVITFSNEDGWRIGKSDEPWE